jgi:hypothetical protein
MDVNGEIFGVGYWPGDSKSGMFGGNSNWRGPIWLAVNFLVRLSLLCVYPDKVTYSSPTDAQSFYSSIAIVDRVSSEVLPVLRRYSPRRVPYPIGRLHESGCRRRGDSAPVRLSFVVLTVFDDLTDPSTLFLSPRIIHIFAAEQDGTRAYNGGVKKLNHDPNFRDYLQFHEFFNGNDGRGLGASHQTGWWVFFSTSYPAMSALPCVYRERTADFRCHRNFLRLQDGSRRIPHPPDG